MLSSCDDTAAKNHIPIAKALWTVTGKYVICSNDLKYLSLRQFKISSLTCHLQTIMTMLRSKNAIQNWVGFFSTYKTVKVCATDDGISEASWLRGEIFILLS